MRILRTALASAAILTPIGVWMYALIYHFRTTMLVTIGIGVAFFAGATIWRWWEMFEGV